MSERVRLTLAAAVATLTCSSALMAVFADSAWVVPVAGAVVIVAVVSEVVHRSPLPSAVEPLVVATAVLFWITWLDARPVAHAGFIPGQQALNRLGSVVRAGFTDVHRLAPPVPATHGLVLLATVGVALVALVVQLIAVTLHRAAASGVPLLALFTTGAAVGRHGAGLIPFVVAAAGFLWLLYVDNQERVSRWGTAVGAGTHARTAAAWSTDPSSNPPSATLGRRIGAAAISLGVVLPVLVPGLHGGIDRPGGGGDSSGTGGNIVTINPIVSVASDLRNSANTPVLSYRTTATDPGYLRLTSLDTFDGTSFSAPTLVAPASSRVSQTMPPSPGLSHTATTRIIAAGRFVVHWLPLPENLTGVAVTGDWRFDANSSTVFSATSSTRDLQWLATSNTQTPSASDLAAAGAPGSDESFDLSVPPPVSPEIRTLTQTVTAHQTTVLGKAVAIQDFLTGPSFHYDTNVSLPAGPAGLTTFLLHTRTGFCQQFATAMAVMARLSGIPSRVAVGFTRGQRQPDGSWLVTTHDAHAWPELFFAGQGWVAFEPTPRGDGQAVRPTYTTVSPDRSRPSSTVSPSPSPSGAAPRLPAGLRPKPGTGSVTPPIGSAGSRSTGLSTRELAGLALLGLVLVLLLTPALGRALVRRRRWSQLHDPRQGISAAWRELRDTAIDVKVGWAATATPRQVDAALAAEPGMTAPARAALHRLARAEEQSRYAATPPPFTGDLRADLAAVRAALIGGRSPAQRIAAILMPASTTRALGVAADGIADLLDVLDAGLATGRRMVTRMGRSGLRGASG